MPAQQWPTLREFDLLVKSIQERFAHVREVSEINKEAAREARELAQKAQDAMRNDTRAMWALIISVAGVAATILITFLKH